MAQKDDKSKSNVCGPCEYRSKQEVGLYWCNDCDDNLCQSCYEHHKSVKVTRTHLVILIEHITKFPDFPKMVSEVCEKHDAPYQNYCTIHQEICCRKCIAHMHSKCGDLPAIDDYVANAKHSFVVEQIMKGVDGLVTFCDQVTVEETKNLNVLESEVKSIEKEIEVTKENINKFLDKVASDVRQKYAKRKSTLESSIQKFVKLKQTVNGLKENMSLILQNGSNTKVFVASKFIENNISDIEKVMGEMESKRAFDEVRLVYNDKLSCIIRDSKCELVSVQIQTKPSGIKFRTNMSKQQHLVQKRPIGDTNLSLVRTFPVDERLRITGCLLLPNKEIVLCAYQLHFLDERGVPKSKLSLTMPFDATLVNNDTIATTDDAHITFVDTNNKQVINQYHATTYVFGITHANGSLIFTTDESTVLKMDTTSKEINATQMKCRHYQCYISSVNGKTCISNWSDNTVKCYDDNEHELWEFKNENVLKYPAGLSLDNQGNVFVAGTQSNNIVIISSNGQHFKEVKLNDSGIQRPCAIHLCNTNRLVLVCSEKGLAAIYSVH